MGRFLLTLFSSISFNKNLFQVVLFIWTELKCYIFSSQIPCTRSHAIFDHKVGIHYNAASRYEITDEETQMISSPPAFFVHLSCDRRLNESFMNEPSLIKTQTFDFSLAAAVDECRFPQKCVCVCQVQEKRSASV